MESTMTPPKTTQPRTPRLSPSIEWDETPHRHGAPVEQGFSPLLFLLQHWLWTLVAIAAAGYAAWQAAERFTTFTYNTESQLMYNRNSAGRPTTRPLLC